MFFYYVIEGAIFRLIVWAKYPPTPNTFSREYEHDFVVTGNPSAIIDVRFR